MSDAVPTSWNPFVASTAVPGVLNFTPLSSPYLSETNVWASDLPVPTGAELYVLGEKEVKPGDNESTLARLLKGLPVADSARGTADERGVLRLLKQLLASTR